MFNFLKNKLARILYIFTLNFHYTTMFLFQAKKYTNHIKYCKKRSPFILNNNSSIKKYVDLFKENGYCSFSTPNSRKIASSILKKLKDEEKNNLNIWKSGRYNEPNFFSKYSSLVDLFKKEISELVCGIYGTNYSIFFGILYKSSNEGKPAEGSQIWHTDGGPGTCINLMYCLSETTKKNGSMKCLPWNLSKSILIKSYDYLKNNNHKNEKTMTKVEMRERKSNFINNLISKDYKKFIHQPESNSGLIYAFRNNCIHAGGYPEPGYTRYVCVFHLYPNEREPNFSYYLKHGLDKKSSFPEIPSVLQ